MSTRILVVEDEEKLARFIALELIHEGYDVDKAGDGRVALDKATQENFDLILLDIMLPGLNGLEVLRRLGPDFGTPVILLTARDAVMDKVAGLDAGADDYLPKPYSLRELLARVQALMRRTYGFAEAQDEIRFGNVTVRQAARTVTKNGKPVNLAQREFELLLYLCQHKNTAIAKEQLLSEVWGAFSEVEPATLAVHIRWLREKLEDDPANPQYIKTVWRLGYMLEAET